MTISLWLMFTAYIFAEPCDSVKTTQSRRYATREEAEARLENMETQSQESTLVGYRHSWCRADIQPKVLETAHRLWWIRGMRVCYALEQYDV